MNSAGIRDAGAHHAAASMNGCAGCPNVDLIVTIPPELTRGRVRGAQRKHVAGAKVMKSVTSPAIVRRADQSAVLAVCIQRPST